MAQFLKNIFSILNKDLTGRTWTEESTHPYFSSMVLFAQRDSDQSYWECQVNNEGNEIFVGICAPDRSRPTEHQINFARKFVSDPNEAFQKAAPILVPAFEDWCKITFPENWLNAFRLVGIMVPVNADEKSPWELTFESLMEREGHQFTCYFEHGMPTHVSIDG